ncbi:MerR family transcriptional regulator [Arenibaculum pallidiluteum]|uniref:MerR family transcriptional regulator n=1 Tax=Arenibaculum pallidiluteum TaxID=2812559 RepID=UPI001A96E80E|nr:MerR family transcriptional regulator [Arenibaculum pallidiluteum]
MASLFPEQRVPRTPVKSATAFRTISEVSSELEVPQHVLRFWETKFPQIRPLKRGGGRRYYRPEDVELLRRIQHLLYAQGYTIKGVQRLLREGRAAEAGHDDQAEPAEAELQAAGAPEMTEEAGAPGDEPEHGRKAELRAILDELVVLRDLLRGA